MTELGEQQSKSRDFGLAADIPTERIEKLQEELLIRARQASEDQLPDESRDLLDARWILNAFVDERERASRTPEAIDGTAGAIARQEHKIVALAADNEHELARREQAHRHRTDSLRLFIALALVSALFLVVIVGVFTAQSSEVITQAAAPIAGLAGIAVGWLFGDRRGSNSD